MNSNADFAGLPPIDLPDGQRLETLADCRAYILALAPREHARWERVVAELLKAAEHGDPLCFTARLIFVRTLHGVSGVGPIPEPRD